MEQFVESEDFENFSNMLPNMVNSIGITERSISSSVESRFEVQKEIYGMEDKDALAVMDNLYKKLKEGIMKKDKSLSQSKVVTNDLETILGKLKKINQKETEDCNLMKIKFNELIDTMISKELSMLQKDLVPLQKAVLERKQAFENKRDSLLSMKVQLEETPIDKLLLSDEDLGVIKQSLSTMKKWNEKQNVKLIFDSESNALNCKEFLKDVSGNDNVYVVCYDMKGNVFGCGSYKDICKENGGEGFMFSLKRNGSTAARQFKARNKGDAKIFAFKQGNEENKIIKCGKSEGGWFGGNGYFSIGNKFDGNCYKLSNVFEMGDDDLNDEINVAFSLKRIVAISFY